jgi:hypothetical protein
MAPSKPVLIDLNFSGVARPVNVPLPVVGGDGVNKAYVDAAITQVGESVTGLKWLEDAAVGTTASINLASPGPTINGVFLTNGMRVLVKDQADNTQNGVYVFNAGALTRAADADTSVELTQAVITTKGGTVGTGISYRQVETPVVLGTSPIRWDVFNISAPLATTTVAGLIEIAETAEVIAGTSPNLAVTPLTLKEALDGGLAGGAAQGRAFTIGDGFSTSFALNHDLNTRDISVSIRTTGTWEEVLAESTATTTSQVIVAFSRIPNVAEFRVLLQPL